MSTVIMPPTGGHPRRLLGRALRAIRVFAETAFQVVVLGSEDKRY